MYLPFYHLKKNPFQINTDPRFLWLGPKHEEGLATLKYGVQDRKGFLIMTGDIGTGKTTLVNALLNSLGENVLVAVIRDPNLELLDFFNYIAHAFNMGREFERKGSFLIYFEKFLVEAHAAGKTVLLIIDESQRITQEILEEVRLLSNIERHDCKLINIFFVGQIEFNDILLRPENRAIRQRITVNYTIPPLTEIETGMYIKHRLEVAGFNEEIYAFKLMQESGSKEFDEYNLELPKNQKEIFSFGAVKEIFSYSRGYPRLINIICDRCLLTGFVEDASTITQEIVRECRAELKIPESGLAGKDKLPSYSEIQEPIVPQVSDRTDGKHHSEAADNGNLILEPEAHPAPHGPVDLKKQNRFFIRLISLLSVLLIVIFVGYANLSQNGESVLANLVRKYAGGQWQSTDRTTEHVAEDEPKTNGQVSAPGETETEPQLLAPAETPAETGTESQLLAPAETETEPQLPAPPEQKEAAEQTNPSVEQKNEEKMSDLAESARVATQDKGKNIQVQPLHLFEKHIIPFSSDTNYPLSTSLKDLDMLVESLLQQPQFKILITGYSDSIGNESYNMKLSEFRANTVKSFLIGKGLPESRIKAEGLGSQNPLASNDSLSGRIANRRVEIEIIHPHDE